MSGLDGGVARFHDIKPRNIEERVSRIFCCAAAGLASPWVRRYLDELRRWGRCRPGDFAAMVPVGYYTIANLICYTPDPPNVDVFKSLEEIRLEAQKYGKGFGDCGTYTACLMTVFRYWGFDTGAELFAQGPSWDHVALTIRAPGVGTILLDASVRPTKPPGYEPPASKYRLRRTIWWRNHQEWVDWWNRGAHNEDMPSV